MTYSTGFLFRSSIRIVGYAFLVGGVLYVLANSVAGIILTLVGAFLAFAKTGSQFDIQKKMMREFVNAFGTKFGSWHSYSMYPDLAVLMRKESVRHRTLGNDFRDSNVHYDAHLLDEAHRKKIIVFRGTTWENASEQGQKMATELDLHFTSYQPKTSEATKARRRR